MRSSAPDGKVEVAKAEIKLLKAKLEQPGHSPSLLDRYNSLSNLLSGCPSGGNTVYLRSGNDEFAPAANLCQLSRSLALADPTFNRMQTQSTGNGFGPASVCTLSGSANAVHYDAYAFNLSGCAAFPTVVTVTACGPGGGAVNTNTDSIAILYRKVSAGNGLTANGSLPGAFLPASPCTNAQGLNDDLDNVEVATNGSTCNQLVTSDCVPLCGGGNTSVPGFKRSLGSGLFTIVITGFGNSNVGNYNLYVDAPGAGCQIAAAPLAAAGSISGRVVNANGVGIGKATVQITDQTGQTLTALTSAFGYYQVDDLATGQTYVVSVASKRYSFTPQAVELTNAIQAVDFTATP